MQLIIAETSSVATKRNRHFDIIIVNKDIKLIIYLFIYLLFIHLFIYYRDDILVDFIMKHNPASNAEAYNVTVALFFPIYMQYIGLAENNFTEPTVYNVTDSGIAYLVVSTFSSFSQLWNHQIIYILICILFMIYCFI